MSINTKQEIKCPSCGFLQEMTVWQSVSASDTDIKDDILKGKVNIFKCTSCGCAALVPMPVLYTDSEKKLMISFVPSADVSERLKNFSEIRETSRKSGELSELEGYNLRFVSGYNEFLEKILIFDNGLHDKVIEFLKLLVLMQEEDKMDNRVAVFGKCEDDFIEFMVQDKKENAVYTSRVPQETYETVKAELQKSGVKYKSFDWEIVDIEYAGNLLRGANNIL